MPATYTLIASNTLSSSAASVTFSSIPGTYTDLVVRCSIRLSEPANSVASFYIYPNGSTTGSLTSNTRIAGEGSTATSGRTSNSNVAVNIATTPNGATSNTFGSAEMVIPNYASGNNKVFSIFETAENNSATVNLVGAKAALWRSTNAITSLEFNADTLTFMSGSSFFLYGIKNS